jgi:UDP-N-acetylmuramoyl-L-alanyl-D-glutamate--2,6-diaminopimelate ligase
LPAKRLHLIGFTGTFGKTSTSEILRALLTAGGTRTAVVGSLGVRYEDVRIDSGGLTTPAPPELHRALRAVAGAGATTAIVEVTSHALRLDRVHGLEFGGGLLAAVLPGEHTDFHRSYEDYVGAKRLFLDYLGSDAALAYDADNHAARRLAADAEVRQVAGFSIDGRACDLQFHDIVTDRHGAAFTVTGSLAGTASGARLRSALLGRGHVLNAALALTYALTAGINLDVARDVLKSLRPLRRRMEHHEIAGRSILDDTAAHADSLRATFEVASQLPHESLAVVYALRGSRGAEVNRQNARTLADLAAIHGADTLIVTASADASHEKDRAVPAEIDATRLEFASRGVPFIWHDTLHAALRDVVDRTRPGDLVLLIGAQGMDMGRTMLESLVP